MGMGVQTSGRLKKGILQVSYQGRIFPLKVGLSFHLEGLLVNVSEEGLRQLTL